MNLLITLINPLIQFFKKIIHWVELRKFKDALRRNPNDTYLEARFTKYCLRHYFHDENPSGTHATEAVHQFENILRSEVLDLEVFYLMGKYYQGKENQKAAEVYRQGIKRYNDYAAKNLEFRNEHVETAFSIALNLLKLGSNQADLELDKFFKHLRKTYLMNFLDSKVAFNANLIGNAPGDLSQGSN